MRLRRSPDETSARTPEVWLPRVRRALPRFGVAGILAIALASAGLASCSRIPLQDSSAVVAQPASEEVATTESSSTDPSGKSAKSDGAEGLSRNQLINVLADSDAVYLGEFHDRDYDHTAQLEIIRALHARDPNIAIAMEMFHRPFQGFIDDYLAGDIGEEEMIAKTEYETRWGFPWELYAPILRFAREEGIPVIAANVPRELTRKVAAGGLDALEEGDFRYAPPVEDIRLDNEGYRAMLSDIFQRHAQMGAGHAAGGEDGDAKANDDGFERFFSAQVLWDETIAESVAISLREDPERQVVVILGRGHVAYDFGVPSRVERRLVEEDGMTDFTGTSVFFAEGGAEPIEPPTPELVDLSPVDYFWSF